MLSEAEGPGGILSALALVGTAIIAVGIAIDTTISVALVEAVDDIEPASVQALQVLWDNDFIPLALGMEPLLISSGVSIVGHRSVGAWLGWVTIVLAVVGFTPLG